MREQSWHLTKWQYDYTLQYSNHTHILLQYGYNCAFQVRILRSDEEVARHIRATRRWNWKRTSSSTSTCLAAVASSCRASSHWRSARLRSGSRTVGWRKKRRCRRSRNWTRRKGKRNCHRLRVPKGCEPSFRSGGQKPRPYSSSYCFEILWIIVNYC